MRVPSLGREDPLEKEMATPSRFLPGNPSDRGAWWSTGSQSQTGLEQLSAHNPHEYPGERW